MKKRKIYLRWMNMNEPATDETCDTFFVNFTKSNLKMTSNTYLQVFA